MVILLYNQQIYQSSLTSMSDEIEDLIANIEQKFDDQFNKEQAQGSPSKISKQNVDDTQQGYNPQSQRNTPFNSQINKSESQRKPQIVIEDDHDNVESHEAEEDEQLNINQNRKLDYGDSDHQQARKHEENDDNDDDEEEGENQNKYKQLSQKLETALKKISSSKKQFGTFHTATASSSDYLNRFEDYQRKREKDLEIKRKIQQQKKFIGLKAKPDINQKSKQIAQQTSYKPIHQRFQHILQDKKKKIETLQESKKQHEEEQYQKFMEQFKKHSKIQPEACRDTQTYFHDMMAWKNKLEKARQQKLKQKEQKQKEGYTFKPQINKKSVKMLQNQKRVPIQERQIQGPKAVQQQYSFQPKINKRRVP